MYGENIDVYSGRDPLLKEFMEAGLDYINEIGLIIFALPVYRIYPTKAYRRFKNAVRRLQRAGEYIYYYYFSLMHGNSYHESDG